MVGVVSSIPSGGNFIFADFETPQCQFCTKMSEMSDLFYLGKTRLRIMREGYVFRDMRQYVHVGGVSQKYIGIDYEGDPVPSY